MLKNGQIFTTTLYKNSNRLNSNKKQKINNIFTITNKENNNNYIDNQDNKLNKAFFTKIKNNVLLSNTYNFKNEYINKKNLRNFFFDNHINANLNNNNNKEKQILIKDNNYCKNNDFPNKNKLNHNITKSQRLFKFYMPKNGNEKRDIPNQKIYRYSSSNMHNNYNYIHNNNNTLINKTNNLINKDRLIKSEKQDLFNNKENNIHIVKHFKKLLNLYCKLNTCPHLSCHDNNTGKGKNKIKIS